MGRRLRNSSRLQVRQRRASQLPPSTGVAPLPEWLAEPFASRDGATTPCAGPLGARAGALLRPF